MIELIELLNQTSGNRIAGYSIVFLIALAILGNVIISIAKAFSKK
jgi:hypothetical protein